MDEVLCQPRIESVEFCPSKAIRRKLPSLTAGMTDRDSPARFGSVTSRVCCGTSAARSENDSLTQTPFDLCLDWIPFAIRRSSHLIHFQSTSIMSRAISPFSVTHPHRPSPFIPRWQASAEPFVALGTVETPWWQVPQFKINPWASTSSDTSGPLSGIGFSIDLRW